MKNTNTLMFILSFFVFQNLNAQEIDTLWTKTYGSGVGNCVIESADHGYAIACNNFGDASLLKMNASGDSIWEKNYGDTNKYRTLNSLALTMENNFVLVGTIDSLILGGYRDYPAGSGNVWLIKTNEYGDTIWTKTYGGTENNRGICAIVTKDGDLLILGSSESFGGENVWLLKINTDGDTIFTKTYPGIKGTSICHSKGNCFIILGCAKSDICLTKINFDGDVLWQNHVVLDENGEESARCIRGMENGYIFTGNINQKGFLIKTDLNGDTVWTKSYRCSDDPDARCSYSFNSVIPFVNKSILIGANLEKGGGCFGDGGNQSGEIMQFDEYGLNTGINFVFEAGRSEINELCSMINTSDTNIVFAGSKNYQIFVGKVTTMLTEIGRINCRILSSFSLSQNYPNPFNPSTTIEFTLPKSEFTTLKVYNILGKEVAKLVSVKLQRGNHTYTFDGSNLASGVYYYQLVAGDFREVKKMLIVK